ncbi:RPA1 [Symbiodinium natans]|uniref:RPA1 protein n=1 Tax=Symbiodinium natans TaxID=878477 RepID=A0A812TMM2_9DINO|nr:RPA1 [Symbiodinium natans]
MVKERHMVELAPFLKKPKVIPLDPEKVVYIVFNTRDDSQCSVAFLLRHEFRQRRWDARLFCPGQDLMQRTPSGTQKLRKNAKARESEPVDFDGVLPVATKAVAVVLMSKGLPFDPVALGAAAILKRTGLGALTVLSQESFWKPDEDYFQLLRDGSVLQEEDRDLVEQILPGYTDAELADALAPLYKILAWTVSPEQNQSLLRQEFSIVEERAKKELQRRIEKVEEQGADAVECFPPSVTPYHMRKESALESEHSSVINLSEVETRMTKSQSLATYGIIMDEGEPVQTDEF